MLQKWVKAAISRRFLRVCAAVLCARMRLSIKLHACVSAGVCGVRRKRGCVRAPCADRLLLPSAFFAVYQNTFHVTERERDRRDTDCICWTITTPLCYKSLVISDDMPLLLWIESLVRRIILVSMCRISDQYSTFGRFGDTTWNNVQFNTALLAN